MHNSARHTCPVCGFPDLAEPPYDEYGCSSFGICPSCGTEFGYSDVSASESRALVHARLRQYWANAGYPWYGFAAHRPKDWSGAAQLAAAGIPVPTPALASNVSVNEPSLYATTNERSTPIRVGQATVSALEVVPFDASFVLRRLTNNGSLLFATEHPSEVDAQRQAFFEFDVSFDSWNRTPHPKKIAES